MSVVFSMPCDPAGEEADVGDEDPRLDLAISETLFDPERFQKGFKLGTRGNTETSAHETRDETIDTRRVCMPPRAMTAMPILDQPFCDG